MIQNEMEKTAMRVSTVSIVGNAALTAFKLAAGIIANSGAMVSDAIHSASDVFSTIIVMIGVKAAAKASDKDHPYGHERLECVAAIVLAVILCITGFGVGYSGVTKIISSAETPVAVPGTLALVAAAVSIIMKEAMFRYTKYYAKKVNSTALMADAWHHRSDALSSIGSLIGVAGARLGYPVLDPVASVVICLFIVKASYDIFKDAVDKMVDKSCDDAFVAELRDFILSQEGVDGIDVLRTRLFGNRVYVEAEILADGEKTLSETHAIAEKVHHGIEQKYPEVKHIMIHVNPEQEEGKTPPDASV